jgi:hypothetical protein
MKSLDHTTARLTFWENQAAALIANATLPKPGRAYLVLTQSDLIILATDTYAPPAHAIIALTPRMVSCGLTAAQWRTIEAALITALREGRLT